MSPGPEFVDDEGRGSAHGPADDVLDTGRGEPLWWARVLDPVRRRPGLRRAGAMAAAALVLLAATATVASRDTVVAGRGSAAPEPVMAGATPPPAIAIVRGVVATRGPLTDYVRQTAASGACPTVPVTSSPTRTIRREVAAALPDFTVLDVASTLDEFGGLCSVRLRARDAHRVVLALVVSAPSGRVALRTLPFALLRVGTDTAPGGAATEWVSGTTVRHWSIVIGAVGRPDDVPSTTDLQRLATQDALTW